MQIVIIAAPVRWPVEHLISVAPIGINDFFELPESSWISLLYSLTPATYLNTPTCRLSQVTMILIFLAG